VTSIQARRGQADARDGRQERAERTRETVVDALLSLIDEGDLRPTAPRIAERAGVALRTVFHHFEDLEALHALAAERQTGRLLAMTRFVPRDGPLEDRIEAFVAERARLLEAISPVRRSALLSEPFSQEIAKRLRWIRQRGRHEVERVFEQELKARSATDRRELVDAIATVAGWPAWEALRAHFGESPAQARRTMARILRALLKEDA
jgi:TetR/AcrR family transcriptional regulator of autoinduction and epiphytic fitness